MVVRDHTFLGAHLLFTLHPLLYLPQPPMETGTRSRQLRRLGEVFCAKWVLNQRVLSSDLSALSTQLPHIYEILRNPSPGVYAVNVAKCGGWWWGVTTSYPGNSVGQKYR